MRVLQQMHKTKQNSNHNYATVDYPKADSRTLSRVYAHSATSGGCYVMLYERAWALFDQLPASSLLDAMPLSGPFWAIGVRVLDEDRLGR